MKIDQVKYFVSVFECGSFSAAAKSRYVSTQAVSKSIAELEREAGVPLFVRRSRGVEPTEFGRAFYTKAAEALMRFEELEELARHASDYAAQATLTIGLCAPDFAGSGSAFHRIEDFFTGGTGVLTKVELIGANGALSRLHSNEFDALITIGRVNDANVDCFALGKVPTGTVMAHTHPLASFNEVTLEQLADYPVMDSLEFDRFNESILPMYLQHGFKTELIPVGTEEGF